MHFIIYRSETMTNSELAEAIVQLNGLNIKRYIFLPSFLMPVHDNS
jgi:hypothetical protein